MPPCRGGLELIKAAGYRDPDQWGRVPRGGQPDTRRNRLPSRIRPGYPSEIFCDLYPSFGLPGVIPPTVAPEHVGVLWPATDWKASACFSSGLLVAKGANGHAAGYKGSPRKLRWAGYS